MLVRCKFVDRFIINRVLDRICTLEENLKRIVYRVSFSLYIVLQVEIRVI